MSRRRRRRKSSDDTMGGVGSEDGSAMVAVLREDDLDRPTGSGGGGGGGGPGGWQYSRNAPHSELGEAVVERRLLALAGYRVVSVPRHLWKVWDRPEEQIMFMHARLAEVEDK